jgi:hypothetical protein
MSLLLDLVLVFGWLSLAMFVAVLWIAAVNCYRTVSKPLPAPQHHVGRVYYSEFRRVNQRSTNKWVA